MNLTASAISRLKEAKKICVLTGAGISAESGVPTFRSKDGIWSKMNPQELASIEGFMSNPKLVWEWYQHRRDMIGTVKPNPGHHALVELEKKVGHFTLATQNVDNLHRVAGSQNVLELHGNIQKNYCLDCQKEFDEEALEASRKNEDDELPRCDCGGFMRPGVVWFGEMLPADVLHEASRAARDCDLFLSIGTAAVVHPAAGLPLEAKHEGAYVIEINPEETAITSLVDELLLGPSGEILPALLKEAFGPLTNGPI